MKEEKTYKALMVLEETHHKIKIKATEQKLTIDEFIISLLNKK